MRDGGLPELFGSKYCVEPRDEWELRAALRRVLAPARVRAQARSFVDELVAVFQKQALAMLPVLFFFKGGIACAESTSTAWVHGAGCRAQESVR